MSILIAPSIFSADYARLGDDIKKLCQAGADLLHIDVMDGHFVENITIGPMVIKAIKPYSTVPFDVHLMITNPEDYLSDFIAAGADQITIHTELEQDIIPLLETLHERGVKAGVSLRPHTSASVLDPFLPYIDTILIMTVTPGFGGQLFLKNQLPKIGYVRQLVEGKKIRIQVDGGITPKTASLCIQNGADTLISGAYIFNEPNWAEAIQTLRDAK